MFFVNLIDVSFMAEKKQNNYAEIVLACIEEKYFKDEIVLEHHSFVKIISGEMKIILADQTHTFGAGDMLLFPRNQLCTLIKYPKDGRNYKSVVMTLTTEKLKTFFTKNPIRSAEQHQQKILTFQKSPLLDSFFSSIIPYFELESELPEKITALKIEEILIILRSIDQNIDGILSDFSEPGKISIADFMEKNFMFNMAIEKFAYLTGRSLTTFKKDFKIAFKTTPQKWLTQKRLELAYYELSEKKRKPVDVYYETGFENLSHFSYAFKKHFGYAPTKLSEQRL